MVALGLVVLSPFANAQTAPPAGTAAPPVTQGAPAQDGQVRLPPAGSAPAGAAAPAPTPSVPQLGPPKSAAPSAPQLSPPKTVSRGASKPERAQKKKDKEPASRPVTGPVATYPGFRMLPDGGSRVFVSVSKKVPITEHKAQGRVVYRMRGVQAPIRTNRLPLLTSFFPTPVGRIQLVEQGTDLDLVIELRAPSEAKHQLLGADGGLLLQVDFPKAENLGVAPPVSAAPEKPRAKRTTDTTSLGGGTGY